MSFNDCITAEDQNELIAIRQGLDTLQWEIGDIANRNYERYKETHSFSYVCQAAGYYCGRSGSRVQQLARAAAFYTEEIRKRYDGILSMEHFIQAMMFKNWEDKLEHAAHGGKLDEPQSVDQMVAESFQRVTPGAPENFPVSPSAVFSYDTAVPSVQIIGQQDNTIQTILGLIGQLAAKLGLSEERKSKVYRAMQLLQEAMCITDNIPN